MFDVKGKSVIVTGGANGLGRAFAEVMADNGADVCIFAIAPVQADAVAAEIGVWGQCVDVTGRAAMTAAFAAVAAKHGKIDAVFANAGIDAGPGFLTPENTRNPDGAIENLDDLHSDKVIETNLTSMFNTIKLDARHMKATGGGKIIATSSIAARCNEAIVGTPYMPAKAAVSHLVRHMAMELAAYNIQVNAIAPGPSVTNIAGRRLKNPVDRKTFETQTLMGRIAEPDGIKGIALYLASPAASYVTGAEMVIDGGSLLRF